jgi:hypothetical protein
MMRLKMAANTLLTLAHSVAHEHYFTPSEDLELMKNLQKQGEVKEMGAIALDLFLQLQRQGTDEHGMSVQEQSRQALSKIRAIFGLHTTEEEMQRRFPDPVPQARNRRPGGDAALAAGQDAGSTPAEGEEPESLTPEEEARERARQLLGNILIGQAEICDAQCKSIREEARNGPSPYERAAEIAPVHPNMRAMRGMQDANFREIRRITNLLLKLKRPSREV